jgi:hypothetical protein
MKMRGYVRWEISGRLIYDWSSPNTNPPVVLGALSAQPGDQFITNLSASYALGDHWRLGVGSYVLQQLSDSRINDLPARIQFGFTVSFQIIFPTISIGLAMFLAITEGLWLRTKDALSNSNDNAIPVTTPTPKAIANMPSQKR